MEQKQPISICIITKDECNVLEECLKRLSLYAQNAGHEIVIVDTGSTDNTIAMCRAYTDSIYEFPWIHDFSAARNYASKKAKHDWILCIDSDEYITFWDEDDLQQQIRKNPKGIGGFSMLCTCGFGVNQYQSLSKVYRLYNRNYFHFERSIHEQINPFNSALGHPCFIIAIEADHYSYSGSPEKLSAKSQRNIKLLEQELSQNPHDPYILFQLGQSYYMVENFEKALYYYDLGLSEDVDPRINYVHTMVVSYGYTLLNLKQYRKALDLENIYDTFGNRADFVFLMGMIYMNNGFFEDAILQFQKATTYDTAEVIGANSFRAWHNIGVIYECTGFPKEAMEHYKKCGDFGPARERLHILQNT